MLIMPNASKMTFMSNDYFYTTYREFCLTGSGDGVSPFMMRIR